MLKSLRLSLYCLSLFLFMSAPGWAQDNPFLRRSPSSQVETRSEADAPNVPIQEPALQDASEAFPSEAPNENWENLPWTLRLKAWFQEGQYELNRLLSDKTLEAKAGNAPGVWLFLMLVAFVYGAFHSIGPGHGKCVVCSYFISEEASIRRGLTLGYLVAAIHAFSAFSVVAILYYALKGSGQLALNEAARYTSWVGYSLIIALGSFLWVRNLLRWRRSADAHPGEASLSSDALAQPASACGHAHHSHHDGDCSAEHADSQRNLFWVAAAIGMVPCPGALTILLFSISLDFLALGVVLALMIALGMGLTISLLAVGTILSRQGSLRWFSRRHSSVQTTRFSGVLGLVGSSFTVLLGVVLLLGSI